MSTSVAAEESYQEGRDLEGQGKYREAVIYYSHALVLDPAYADVYFDRGFAYSKLGDHEKAVLDYSQAIALGPEDPVVYHNRGFARAKLGDLESAIDDYNRALHIDPRAASTYLHRGLARQKLGQLALARVDFGEAVRLNPGNTNALRRLGEVVEQLGLDLCALRVYKQGAALDGTFCLLSIKPAERLIRSLNGLPEPQYSQPAPAEAIASLKEVLGVELPERYLDFLQMYNGGEFCFARMYGLGEGIDLVETIETAEARLPGMLELHLVPFGDNYTQGFFYCFDLSLMKDGECPVRQLDLAGPERSVDRRSQPAADNFSGFILGAYMKAAARLELEGCDDDFRTPEHPLPKLTAEGLASQDATANVPDRLVE